LEMNIIHNNINKTNTLNDFDKLSHNEEHLLGKVVHQLQ